MLGGGETKIVYRVYIYLLHFSVMSLLYGHDNLVEFAYICMHAEKVYNGIVYDVYI